MRAFLRTCFVSLLIPTAMAQTPAPTLASLGYKDVADAFASLRANTANAVTTTPEGWIVVSEGARVLWTFAPPGHASYPAVVRRSLTMGEDRKPKIETRVYCEAGQAACDQLERDFPAINERIRQGMEGKR